MQTEAAFPLTMASYLELHLLSLFKMKVKGRGLLEREYLFCSERKNIRKTPNKQK